MYRYGIETRERCVRLHGDNVLIVPLWNWNSGGSPQTIRSQIVLIVPLWNWNIFGIYHFLCFFSVLIVPLWNWNVFFLQSLLRLLFVLIVPLWNWNNLALIRDFRELRLNCTVMELKRSNVGTFVGCRPSLNCTVMELKQLE